MLNHLFHSDYFVHLNRLWKLQRRRHVRLGCRFHPIEIFFHSFWSTSGGIAWRGAVDDVVTFEPRFLIQLFHKTSNTHSTWFQSRVPGHLLFFSASGLFMSAAVGGGVLPRQLGKKGRTRTATTTKTTRKRRRRWRRWQRWGRRRRRRWRRRGRDDKDIPRRPSKKLKMWGS